MTGTHKATEADRGQAFTLEALFASLMLLAAVLFALQTTAVTPLTGSTSNSQIQNQQSAIAEGVLASAAEQGYLKDVALYYDTDMNRWHGTDHNGDTHSSPGDLWDEETKEGLRFGKELEEAFIEWGVAVNVNVHYYEQPNVFEDRRVYTEELVDMGTPSPNSVSAQRTVVLYEDDYLRNEDGSQSDTTLGEADDDVEQDFYAPDTSLNSDVYNTAIIEVEVWRI